MSRLVILFIFLLSFGFSAYAGAMSATCGELAGPETYYFSKIINPEKWEKVGQFNDHTTGMSNKKLIVLWDESKKIAQVALVNGAVNEDAAWDDLFVLEVDKNNGYEQITFVGFLEGAPVMISAYPKVGIVIYSQHSVWPTIIGQGSRTFMLHAKCDFKPLKAD